jgi:hypothetical protein
MIEGDVTDLISGNFGDVERLRLRIAAVNGPVEPSRGGVIADLRDRAGWR